QGKNSAAAIETDGTYKTAVPVGKVTVTIQNGATPEGLKPVRIPPNYADSKKSGLEFEITSGSQTIDLELKGSAGPAPKGPGPRPCRLHPPLHAAPAGSHLAGDSRRRRVAFLPGHCPWREPFSRRCPATPVRRTDPCPGRGPVVR